MLQPVALAHKSLADYTHIVGRPLIEEIRELAAPLQGRRVMHLSATAFGGGVSEILYTLVPLMKDAGLDVEWQVIYGREEFFNATKIMHNALQGNPQDLTEDQWVKKAKTLNARPPMPWFNVRDMRTSDLRAVYRYVRHLGPAGQPAPAYVPPDKTPPQPYVQFPSPPK